MRGSLHLLAQRALDGLHFEADRELRTEWKFDEAKKKVHTAFKALNAARQQAVEALQRLQENRYKGESPIWVGSVWRLRGELDLSLKAASQLHDRFLKILEKWSADELAADASREEQVA